MNSKISFFVRSINCIACTPVFKRELLKIHGIVAVNPLVMMNAINVEIDDEITTKDEVKGEILKIASKAGFGGKVVFSPI